MLRTYTIITTTDSGTMAQLHDRMPVILDRADCPAWLGEAEADPAALLRPAAKGVLRPWSVSRAVNSVRNNVADLLDPLGDPHAPLAGDAPAGPNPA